MADSDNSEQSAKPEKPVHTAWMRHLDGIADELMRLTAICQVDLRTPGTIERVLHGDDTVCGSKNAMAFDKLRKLLGATYKSLNAAIDRLGADEVKAITNAIVERIDEHRAAGGQKPGNSHRPFGN